ncbi:hypothetical protein J6590_041928 [Homalodisca vitripennis]|nr:hypothetical protein J6590_041928 [Homalodisca vitripennis]
MARTRSMYRFGRYRIQDGGEPAWSSLKTTLLVNIDIHVCTVSSLSGDIDACLLQTVKLVFTQLPIRFHGDSFDTHYVDTFHCAWLVRGRRFTGRDYQPTAPSQGLTPEWVRPLRRGWAVVFVDHSLSLSKGVLRNLFHQARQPLPCYISSALLNFITLSLKQRLWSKVGGCLFLGRGCLESSSSEIP